MQAVRRNDDIANQLRIEWNLDRERVLHRPHGCDRVHGRAHSADALGEGPGIARVAALHDEFQAPDHGPRGVGLGNGIALHLGFNAQMAFDAGNRIYYDSFISTNVGHVFGLSL